MRMCSQEGKIQIQTSASDMLYNTIKMLSAAKKLS